MARKRKKSSKVASTRKALAGGKDRRFGRIKFEGLGSRTRKAEVTNNVLRKRQFPIRSKTSKRRFVIPSERFSYLPTTTKKRKLGIPTSLGDNVIVIIDFKPSATLKKIINDLMGNIFQKRKQRSRRTVSNVIQVKKDIRTVARNYYKRIREEMFKKIDVVVPEFTRRLRNGMKASLTRSINSLINIPYIFKLNTLDTFGNPIFYANPVNNMPTDWLAHPPNEPLTRMHKGKPKYLFDPGAETGWYEKVLEHGRSWAKRHIGSIRLDIIKLYGLTTLSDLIYQNLISHTKFK